MHRLMPLFIVLQMVFSSSLLMADEAAPAAPPDQGFKQMIIMFLIIAFFFYFMLVRPEQKRRKAVEKQRSALTKGDRVIAVGIIGTVVKVLEGSVILKMYDGAKIEVLKAAISDVTPGGGLSEESKEEFKE